MMGGNAIGRLGLDGVALDAVAARIGPAVDDLSGPAQSLPLDLLHHFDVRGGYPKPAEGASRLVEADTSIQVDLSRLTRTQEMTA